MPPKPAPLVRVLDLEHEYVEHAAYGYVDPTDLLQFAETRSKLKAETCEYVDDPMLIQRGRDRPRDVREEIVDAVNHTLFHFQEHPDDPHNARYMAGLSLIVRAYEQFKVDP